MPSAGASASPLTFFTELVKVIKEILERNLESCERNTKIIKNKLEILVLLRMSEIDISDDFDTGIGLYM